MAPEIRDAAQRRVFDPSVAHPARVYDYWLGGKDNFAADREAAERALQALLKGTLWAGVARKP